MISYENYKIEDPYNVITPETPSYFWNLLDIALYALIRSARQVERLSDIEWDPDTLRLTENGIALFEADRENETIRQIEYRNILNALEISLMYV